MNQRGVKAQSPHPLGLGALLERAGRELRYAFRSFRRAPLAAATIIATVGLGLGLVAAVFSILSLVVFHVDEVRNPHELYEVTRQPSAVTAPEPFTREQFDALARETDVFSAYGVLSFLVEQRRGEIGVRMALGASRAKIGQLVLRQSARPVMAGALIGASLTLGLGALLLATPAAEQISATVRLFDPTAYVSSLLIIATACAGAALIPALRAARVNPLAALRED